MTDHESFLLLAAKRIGEPLTEQEATDLAAHLDTCPSCRAIASGMERDDVRLRSVLGEAPVSPRVRERVLAEAAGRRSIDPRLVLVIAAALALAAIAGPVIIGSAPGPRPLPSPTTGETSVVPSPSATGSGASPSAASPSATPSGAFVVGAYVYGDSPPRRDTIAARLDGGPRGEWSRRMPATGDGNSFAGPITCLEISGSDAWLAGPTTTATDGSSGGAVMIHVHDGGPAGNGDTVVMWQSTAGQTLTTMTEWCEQRFIPAGPFPLSSGDVVVEDGLP